MRAYRDVAAARPRPAALDDISRVASTVDHVEAFSPRHLLSADDVAVWLDVSKPAVYRLVRAGRLAAVSLGRFYRFDAAAIQKFIDAGGAGLDGPR